MLYSNLRIGQRSSKLGPLMVKGGLSGKLVFRLRFKPVRQTKQDSVLITIASGQCGGVTKLSVKEKENLDNKNFVSFNENKELVLVFPKYS